MTIKKVSIYYQDGGHVDLSSPTVDEVDVYLNHRPVAKVVVTEEMSKDKAQFQMVRERS